MLAAVFTLTNGQVFCFDAEADIVKASYDENGEMFLDIDEGWDENGRKLIEISFRHSEVLSRFFYIEENEEFKAKEVKIIPLLLAE